ncbi:MAG: sulfatase-like hydrolase/transferase, partial [bacterium]|nr:sulfatase-like hydrolase/transferase [bacterium]
MKPQHLSRRRFLQYVSAGAVATALGSAQGQTAARPNVLLILSDDQGSIDLNCYGATDLITPNLDRLASRGVRFTQFYAGAPVCSPSRACLLTGRYPQRAQLATNAWGDRGMPAAQVTIAEMVRGAGYRTGIFGKWHLGDVLPLSPNEQGFDEFLGHKVGCIDNYSHFFYWSGPNRHDLWRNDEIHWEDGNYFP